MGSMGSEPHVEAKRGGSPFAECPKLDWRAFTNVRHTEQAALAEHIHREQRSDGVSPGKPMS